MVPAERAIIDATRMLMTSVNHKNFKNSLKKCVDFTIFHVIF
jgi:hypothetical protein